MNRPLPSQVPSLYLLPPSPLCNTMPYNTRRRSKPACLRTCELESILPRFTMSTPQVCTSPRSQPYSLPGETKVLPMRTTRFILCAIAYGLLVNALPVHAQNRLRTILKDDWSTSWDDAQKNCSDAKATKHWSDVEGCAVTVYSLKPPGPEIGSIAPGSSVALGLGLKYSFMHPSSKPGHVGSESDLHFRGLYSFTNFYLMEGRYDFKMPAIGQADVTKSRRFEDQVTLSIFVSRANLAKQNFYGIGPNTTLAGLAVYRQLQDKIGASADWPILSWFAAGGTVQLLLPGIKGVSGSTVPTVAQAYGNPGAPGVSA